MQLDFNHDAIFLSGSLLALVCLITPLLFKKELKQVEHKYYLVAYYVSVIIYFLTSLNPHDPVTESSQIKSAIATINSVFQAFLLSAFLCHREGEKGLFYALVTVAFIKAVTLYLHTSSAYLSVVFATASTAIGFIAVAKNLKNKADVGLALCFAVIIWLLVDILLQAPVKVSNLDFYDHYYPNLLLFIPAFICGSTIFIFLRYVIDLNEQLRELAHKDPLTGLLNRRFAFDIMTKQWLFLSRKHQQACIIMTDIDHFKSVNDGHGHQVGDQALILFAQTLEDELRKYDLACRYGGEEFLLFLPDTSIEQAAAVAERIRARIESSELSTETTVFSITASFGVASTKDTSAIEKTVNLADNALYQAKHSGRNKVVCSTGDNEYLSS